MWMERRFVVVDPHRRWSSAGCLARGADLMSLLLEGWCQEVNLATFERGSITLANTLRSCNVA